MTVSCRRSAVDAVGGGTGAAPARWAAAGAPTPHAVQNRFSAGFSLLHAAQRHGKGDPQSPQNFQPAETLAPHCGQFIRSPSRKVVEPCSRVTRPIMSRKHRTLRWSNGRLGGK